MIRRDRGRRSMRDALYRETDPAKRGRRLFAVETDRKRAGLERLLPDHGAYTTVYITSELKARK